MEKDRNKIEITIPISKLDFESASDLICQNIARSESSCAQSLKDCSVGQVLVAKSEGKVVGVLKQSRPGDVFGRIDEEHFDLDLVKADKKHIGWIGWIAVDKGFQKKGIGKSLVEEALLQQKDWGAQAVQVHCWRNSPGKASEKLFQKMGFEALRVHEAPWEEWSKEVGPDKYFCQVCGNPCVCDELCMIKYL